MSEIQVRQALPPEFGEVGEMTVRAYVSAGYLQDRSDYAAVLRDVDGRAGHSEVLVAVDDSGALLGSVTIVLADSEYAELAIGGEVEFRMLAVAETARRRGVGEALTRAVLDRTRELGRHRVVLCSMDLMRPAHRLYERLGFTRLPERDWEPEPGVALLAYSIELD